MGNSRNEDILQAMIDGTDSSALPKPQSREEKLLHAILDKINAGGGGEGSGSGLSMHFCTVNEYNQITGVPTIENPSETTFYLVPTGTGENDLYDEWVYVDGNWERFGSGSHVVASLASLSDVVALAPQDGQTIVYDSELGKWKNVKLQSFCLVDPDDNENDIIFDSGSIDD